MAYIAAADFGQRTVKPWCAGLVLSERDGTTDLIDSVISLVTTRIEHDLADDFEPSSPDDDETLEVDGSGRSRLYIPRRVRSLTTVKTRDETGTLTLEASTTYRLHQSLNAAGTAMQDQRKLDRLEVIPGELLSTGLDSWPLGEQTVQLVGKFGWAAVPSDIKRLVALLTYDFVKASDDPLSEKLQKATVDGVITFGPSREITEIVARYRRGFSRRVA